MMKVALYARGGEGDAPDAAAQVDILLRFAKRRGWRVVKRFVEKSTVHAQTRRPALKALMEEAARRPFDGVLVWRADRIGRSLPHLVRLIHTLAEHRLHFISLGDPGIDTTAPGGGHLVQLTTALCAFDRTVRQAGVTEGHHRRRSSGGSVGRPKVEVDLERLQRLLESGTGMAGAAEAMGVSESTLRRRLHAEGGRHA